MKKTKVLHFCVSGQMGGAEQSLLSFVKSSCNEVDHSFLFAVESGPFIEKLRELGFRCHSLPMPKALLHSSRNQFIRGAIFILATGAFQISYIRNIRKYIRRGRYNIVHTTGLKCHVLAALAAINLKTKVLCHIRDIFSNSAVLFCLKQIKKFANVSFIYNSRASSRPIDANGQVIYNGFEIVPKSNDNKVSNSIRNELKLDGDAMLVAHVGVFAGWKGQDVFIDCAKLILESTDRKIHFLLIGDEIYDTKGEVGIRDQLHKRVQKHQLSSHVHFLGFKDNVREILAECSILCHTSKNPEPFGRVVIEAMLSKTAVVAANQGGVLEIINDHKDGLLANSGDPSDYFRKVTYLIDNEDETQSMIDSAFNKASTFFSLEGHKKNLLDVYAKLSGDRQ